MSPEEDQKATRAAKRLMWFLRVCRWIGYVVVYFLMVDAPAWGWGILLAIILKPTNRLTIG